MSYRRALRVALALIIVSALMPLGAASAARNRAPRIVKAVMKDINGNGLADRIVLTYNEKIRHKADLNRFPFVVQGYKIAKIGGVRGRLTLGIILVENPNAPAKPASVKYTRTRKQPVVDMKRMQARKQLLTRNIIGLPVSPPPVEEFTLSVSKTGDGLGVVADDRSKIDCGTTCSATYPAGTNVTLTATPDATTKATFGSWTGCSSTTETCTITMDADKNVSAAFSKAGTFALSLTKAGAGSGTVTSTSSPTQPSQINCGTSCTATYPKDAIVTLTAAPDQGMTFAGFSGGGCSGTSTTCNVTMDAAKPITATFNKIGTFDLVVAKAGAGTGTVTSTSSPAQPAQIDCGGTCFAGYPAGTQVTLTAAPDQDNGSTFTGFTGGGCTGNATTCTVLIDQSKTVTATFASPTFRTLTVSPSGTGTVTSTAPSQTDGIACGADCTANYLNGTTVTLQAQPGAGYQFTGWGGAATCGQNLSCQVVMDANKNVTATFTAVSTATKTLTVTATGGTVSCVPSANPGPCNGTYATGTEVVISATAGQGMNPLTPQWTGCDTAVALVCNVAMTTDKVITVTFTPLSLPNVQP